MLTDSLLINPPARSRILQRGIFFAARRTTRARVMKPLERSLQASIVRLLNDLHRKDKTFVWRKRHGTHFGVAGDPDFYGVWGGVAWAIEHTPGKTLPSCKKCASPNGGGREPGRGW